MEPKGQQTASQRGKRKASREVGESPDPKRPKTEGEKMAETTSMEKYKPEDRRPFVLFAEKTDKSPLNAVTIGRQLKEVGLLTGMIISIKNIKANTIKILCENSKTANKLISSQAQLAAVPFQFIIRKLNHYITFQVAHT